jgi:tetratricopeptide (TPR) repeat protein/transcriptional regulator with XRE-family HTH domain
VGDRSETFADVLRKLRADARLTQAELAEAAGVSFRAISDLERGLVATPQRETVRLLADALQLIGPARVEFEVLARGSAAPAEAKAGGVAVALRTLPRDIASFTGRRRELERLAEATVDTSGVVSIHAIGGMAGVGKTAFAVHVAHRLAGQFPAGQIFLPLHGHTPGQRPVDPEDALATLLLTTGIPAAQIPPGLEARMALWRDRLAERQLLLILDDAVGSEQVRPLLPGTGGSLVLVTSRRHLSALEDATVISLDTLPADDAAGLLVRLVGRSGLGPDDPSVRDIVSLCGYLPLAIGMVARQLHHHPAWSLASRAAELAAERDRLELMATENVSVTAAFDLSYADLIPDRQRLFRRLGLHPGSEFDAYAVAMLDGTSLAAARQNLAALHGRYLLTEPVPGRYRMHDLVREHARALAARHEADADQTVARLLDYYQHTATRAEAVIRPQGGTVPGPATGSGPGEVTALPDAESALAWVRAERANLLASLDYVTATARHVRVVALTNGVAAMLRIDGPWADALTRHAAALRSARYLGDRAGQAGILCDLGGVYELTGDYPAAGSAHEEARELYRDLGDRAGQARATEGLGRVKLLTGDVPAGGRAYEEALELCRDLGDRAGQGTALTGLGNVRRMTGDFPGAISVLEEALGLCRGVGDRAGQARVLNYLGDARRETGDYPGAARDLAEALRISRDLGSRLAQGNILTILGIVHRLTGDYPAALSDLAESLDVFSQLGERIGQAYALSELGIVRRLTGDYPAARRDAEQALRLCRDLGFRSGEANVLFSLAVVRRLTGDHPGAAAALEEAIAIFRETGERGSWAEALNELGSLHRVRGELTAARDCHREALEVARTGGDARNEANALAGLGRCAVAEGRAGEAADLLGQALEILTRIGAAEAGEVAAELDSLGGRSEPA